METREYLTHHLEITNQANARKPGKPQQQHNRRLTLVKPQPFKPKPKKLQSPKPNPKFHVTVKLSQH